MYHKSMYEIRLVEIFKFIFAFMDKEVSSTQL